MKNLTALLAAFCVLSCLTGCAGTEVSAPQTTAPETSAVTDSTDTTTAAVTTTAAETTAVSTEASDTSDTTGTADSTQTTASTASGTTGKTTAGTTGTTEPVEETVSVTLKGHVAVLVDDIEYNETPCTEGYVVFRAYQSAPQAIRLPLDVCAGMSSSKVYTFEFADTAVSDLRSKFFFYTDAGAVCADYSELIPKYGRNANIREVQQNEYGLDCDRTECVGLTSDKIPKEAPATSAKSSESFKGEVIKAYSAPAFDTSSYDYILLLRDGEPAILRAKKGVSGQVSEGKEYQFTFNKDGNLIRK